MIDLPCAFLRRPIAHRALHDLAAGRPENSRAAVLAAVAGNFGIEIDLQLSADGHAMVFHDYDLGRVTLETGPIRQRSAKELAKIPLIGGNECVPTFSEVLGLVAGRVPLLVETKDQDGALGPNVGALEEAAAADAKGYDGPLAFMSFNPHAMRASAKFAPTRPAGLVTSDFKAENWPTIPKARRAALIPMPDLEDASFISHDARDLTSPHVAAAKAAGKHVLCWTIRSREAEVEARRIAENVTFEGYLPA